MRGGSDRDRYARALARQRAGRRRVDAYDRWHPATVTLQVREAGAAVAAALLFGLQFGAAAVGAVRVRVDGRVARSAQRRAAREVTVMDLRIGRSEVAHRLAVGAPAPAGLPRPGYPRGGQRRFGRQLQVHWGVQDGKLCAPVELSVHRSWIEFGICGWHVGVTW